MGQLDREAVQIGHTFADYFPPETTDFVRLFMMVPGQNHYSGGTGPREFDALATIDAWVDRGIVPDKIVMARRAGGETQQGQNGMVDRTRPVCPYPQVAIYDGTGNIDDEESFHCGMRQVRD